MTLFLGMSCRREAGFCQDRAATKGTFRVLLHSVEVSLVLPVDKSPKGFLNEASQYTAVGPESYQLCFKM